MAESLITSAATSVISSVLNNLTTLSSREIIFPGDVSEKVRLIEAKLRLIKGYLQDADNHIQKNHLTESWLHEIRHVAYRAQDVIERLNYLQRRRNKTTYTFSRYLNIPEYLKNLHEIGKEIVKINNFIPGISDIANNLNCVNLGESSSMANQIEDWWDPRSAIQIIDEDEVVGFDSDVSKILNELMDPSNKQLSVVSIFGMGGIGKSTLVRKVFNCPEAKTNFDINIWITISQRYNVPNLHKEILKAINPNEDFEKMSVKEMREKISRFFKEKKYLIVIDDIWTTKSWDDINPNNSIFPNMNNGSKIILTSRNLEVGKYPAMRIFIHEVNLLDDEKSWELLRKKAFPAYATVSDEEKNQLECLGPQLAKKCNGLPLALIVLGGYLSRHLDYQTWSRNAEYVDWNKTGNQINILEILALSYDDLPNELKPIFLYIAAFPEDKIIKSSDLIRLWIAEGFIHPNQNYNLENVARMYMDELYERGLIQVVRKCISHGRITTIRIHDVLREWGIKRAKDEGFFDVIKDWNHATSFDYHYRVSVYGDCDEDVTTLMPHLRTFLGFELPKKKFYLRDFRSRSLHVFSYNEIRSGDITKRIQKLPKDMKHMVLLRYLSLENCYMIYFHSSIGQLSNLQTLLCRKSQIKSLPSSLFVVIGMVPK